MTAEAEPHTNGCPCSGCVQFRRDVMDVLQEMRADVLAMTQTIANLNGRLDTIEAAR